MAEPYRMTAEQVKQLYTQVGLALSDEDLQAVLPVVQAFYDGAPIVEQILQQEDEPSATFHLPPSC